MRWYQCKHSHLIISRQKSQWKKTVRKWQWSEMTKKRPKVNAWKENFRMNFSSPAIRILKSAVDFLFLFLYVLSSLVLIKANDSMTFFPSGFSGTLTQRTTMPTTFFLLSFTCCLFFFDNISRSHKCYQRNELNWSPLCDAYACVKERLHETRQLCFGVGGSFDKEQQWIPNTRWSPIIFFCYYCYFACSDLFRPNEANNDQNMYATIIIEIDKFVTLPEPVNTTFFRYFLFLLLHFEIYLSLRKSNSILFSHFW